MTSVSEYVWLITGSDPAKKYRCEYTTESQAREIIKKHGDALKMCEALLLPMCIKIDRGLKRGDVVLNIFPSGTILGIYLDPFTIFRMDTGILRTRPKMIAGVWRCV